MTSNRSFHVKDKLDALELIEDIDYSLPNDVRAVERCARNKTYQSLQSHTRSIQNCRLTATALRACLMRVQRRPKQKVDPVIYCDYYLLLEKTYKLYTDYEKQLLSIQLEQKAHQLEHQAQESRRLK